MPHGVAEKKKKEAERYLSGNRRTSNMVNCQLMRQGGLSLSGRWQHPMRSEGHMDHVTDGEGEEEVLTFPVP